MLVPSLIVTVTHFFSLNTQYCFGCFLFCNRLLLRGFHFNTITYVFITCVLHIALPVLFRSSCLGC
jgi:hypothetical protein